MVKSWFNKILPSLGKQHKEEKKSPVPQGLGKLAQIVKKFSTDLILKRICMSAQIVIII